MHNRWLVRTAGLLAATSFGVLGLASGAAAQPTVFPAGVACQFELALSVTPAAQRVVRVFSDKDGHPIRYLFAGKGAILSFTNTHTGVTQTYRTGGSVEQVTPNPDGTQTWVSTGHEGLILYPTDSGVDGVPGPSTILYIGRIVFTVDPAHDFFYGVQSFTGRSIDICAALSD
jgi:hypothetical protein